MVWLNVLYNDLVLTVGAEHVQHFLQDLLRDGSSYADGEMMLFLKMKALRRACFKVSDFHVMNQSCCYELKGAIEMLLPAVLCSTIHSSVISSSFGHLALFPQKLCLVFLTWLRSFSFFLHFLNFHFIDAKFFSCCFICYFA